MYRRRQVVQPVPGRRYPQQFQGDPPTLQNDYKTTKSYELKVVEVAVGDLSDGENRLDRLRFTNFVGNPGHSQEGLPFVVWTIR